MAGLLETLRGIQFQPSAGSMGLLQMGANLLANSGPSTTPQNFGSALGKGVNGFTQGFMGFNQQQQEQELQAARVKMMQDQLAMQEAQQSALKGISLKDQGAVDKLLQAGDVDNAIKLQKMIDPSKGLDPYFQAIPTSDGYVSFNARNGQFSPLMQSGQPLKQPAADPYLQGMITRAKEGEKINNVTLSDGRQIPARMGDVVNTTIGNSSLSMSPDAINQLSGKSTGDPELDKLIAASQEKFNAGLGQSTADKEAQQVTGKAQAEMSLNYPKMEANALQMIKQLEALKTHPGMKGIVGAPDSLAGAVNWAFGGSDNKTRLINGTEEAGFISRLEQLKGGQFLQAYNSLKGAGAITDVEGKKAEDAIARMQTSQSEKEFIDAINEFEGVIARGMEAAKRQAGGYAPSNNAPHNQNQMSDDDLLKHYLEQ
ncbi:hypothetical protein V2P20_09010 [Methylobacter sp. Wu1]|uniref:hypothetical protein n=1 Tax=Methylobacter sp. Wu1 TaxID=3119359 RepID=UPI002F92F764